eukprot:TRINITY_DN7416_c0_g1_i1.p1 TRINITY_DN7416_c0_g1~~TRINITY_DN7416_c0_g1_i1.p1  ORF type:complete len:572 (-),score=55.06 TRINITY_DN7416_c0_g1_i1:148-1863(-)
MKLFLYLPALLCFVVSVCSIQYPIEGSWFSDRYSLEEWLQTLQRFQKQGGQIIWQRGPNLRIRPGGIPELKKDPDFVWCWARGDCIQQAVDVVNQNQAKLGNWLTYRYDDSYSDSTILRCANLDRKYILSRIYWRLLVPRSWTPDWNCTIKPGDTVDVLLIYSNAWTVDPHRLLIDAADKLGMQVYLGMMGTPSWDETAIMPTYYEFFTRHLKFLSESYASHPSFIGLYQTSEAFLGERPSPLAPVFKQIRIFMDKYLPGKKFVISPYPDLLRFVWTHSQTLLQDHIEGFKELARTGVNTIAIQEGRGCGHCAYYYDFEKNMTIESVDKGLDDILLYVEPSNVPPHSTFDQIFAASNQVLYDSLATAVEDLKKEGVNVELWLNVEAFEYLRTKENSCEPVDEMGNGMAEIMDRTSKSRLDWALTTQSSKVSHIMTWTWDWDFTCVPSAWKQALTDDVLEDWDRPIVNWAVHVSGSDDNGDAKFEVHGFSIAKSTIHLACRAPMTSLEMLRVAPAKLDAVDSTWGLNHHFSPRMESVTVTVKDFSCPKDAWVAVNACLSSRCSNHNYYFKYQ